MRTRISCLTFVLALSAIGLHAQTSRATGSIELTDPAGDVVPIETSNGPQPGIDIIKLSITSDGKQISVATTLASGSGRISSRFLELYFDTDRSAKTGVTLLNPEISGVDLRGELDACAAYSDRSSGCIGGSKAPITRSYSTLRLFRYKGKAEWDGVKAIVTTWAIPPEINAPEVPIVGALVKGTLDYSSLNVEAGQTIRILARELSAGVTPTGETLGYFPEILLKLK